MNDTPLRDNTKLNALRSRYKSRLHKALIAPTGQVVSPTPRVIQRVGRRLRDEQVWQYPILPGAIQVYQELASTREWTVSGKPLAVSRSVEWLNNARSVNPHTGLVDYGFDNFIRRRVLDYLCVGMTMMAASNDLDPRDKTPPLEYLDPTMISFRREVQKYHKNGFVVPVTDDEKVWVYNGARELRSADVRHHYPVPIGAVGFTAPILYLLPTALLAWLIRESDTMQVDGRKIRDLILVGDANVRDAIEEGILMQIAIASGEDPDEVGVPIIPISGQRSGQSIKDLFARLGLADIPETLNREEFTFYYVNEIAAALGLALRHFWNNEKTTNRALETVQEQRQQQKGPSTYVRTEQRLINQSGWLQRFGGSRKTRTRFAFVEETDMSGMKDRAEVIKSIAEGFGQIMDRLGAVIAVESLIAWLQTEGALPNELELINTELPAAREDSDSQTNLGEEETAASDPVPTTAPQTLEAQEKKLDYDEIIMNGNGAVVSRRSKIYTIGDALLSEVSKKVTSIKGPDEENTEAKSYFSEEELSGFRLKLLKEANNHNRALVVKEENREFLETWVDDQKLFKDRTLVKRAFEKCKQSDADLTEDEQEVIDIFVLELEQNHDNAVAV